MKQTKLQITIDITSRPSKDELYMLDFKSELEYWIDLVYEDAPLMLDGATFELVEYDL